MSKHFIGSVADSTVIEVVAVNVNDGSHKRIPLEMTKPPEGGLSPQEQLTWPAGQGGVSSLYPTSSSCHHMHKDTKHDIEIMPSLMYWNA